MRTAAPAGRRREDERKRYGPVIVADEFEGFSSDVNPFPPLLDETSVASTSSGLKLNSSVRAEGGNLLPASLARDCRFMQKGKIALCAFSFLLGNR